MAENTETTLKQLEHTLGEAVKELKEARVENAGFAERETTVNKILEDLTEQQKQHGIALTNISNDNPDIIRVENSNSRFDGTPLSEMFLLNAYAKAIDSREDTIDTNAQKWGKEVKQAYASLQNSITRDQVDGFIDAMRDSLGKDPFGVFQAQREDIKDEYATVENALNSGGSQGGTGTDLSPNIVPRLYATNLHRDVYLATRVVQSLPSVAMPTGQVRIPKNFSRFVFQPHTQNTEVTAADPSQGHYDLDAKTVAARTDLSVELEDYNIIGSLVGELASNFVLDAASSMDNLVMNGDTNAAGSTNVNGSANTGATPFLRLIDGLRKYANRNSGGSFTDAGGSLTVDNVIEALGKMGKYAIGPNRPIAFTDIRATTRLLALDEAQTVDQIGDRASILTGQVGALFNVPIIPSAEIPLTSDQAADDGKVSTTSANNTRGLMVIVVPSMFRVGIPRPINVTQRYNNLKLAYEIVADYSLAFAGYFAGSTSSSQEVVVIGNI